MAFAFPKTTWMRPPGATATCGCTASAKSVIATGAALAVTATITAQNQAMWRGDICYGGERLFRPADPPSEEIGDPSTARRSTHPTHPDFPPPAQPRGAPLRMTAGLFFKHELPVRDGIVEKEDRGGEGEQQDQEHQPALAAFGAHASLLAGRGDLRFECRAPVDERRRARAFVRHRRSAEQFLALLALDFGGELRRLFDEFFVLVHLRLDLLLFLEQRELLRVERRGADFRRGFARALFRKKGHTVLRRAIDEERDEDDDEDDPDPEQRQREGEAGLEPVHEILLLARAVIHLETGGRGDRIAAPRARVGADFRNGLRVLGARVIDGAERLVELLADVEAVPRFRVDFLEHAHVRAERFVDALEQLDALLRVVRLALEHDDRAREFLDHLLTARLELLLAPAHFLELALLFFDQLLLPLEREKLILRFLHLVVEMLAAEGVIVGKFEFGIFGSAHAFRHDARECRSARLDFQIFHAPHRENQRQQQHDGAQQRREREGKPVRQRERDVRDAAQIGQRGERDEKRDVNETDDEAERAAEAAHDLARIVFLEIWKQRAEADGEPAERRAHQADRDGEERDLHPREVQHQARRDHQRRRDERRGERAGPEFLQQHFVEPERREADDPEPAAFERKLREDEARREGGKRERGRGEIEVADHRFPKWILKIERHVAQVQHVDAE